MTNFLIHLFRLAMRRAESTRENRVGLSEREAQDQVKFCVTSGRILLNQPHRQAIMRRIYDLSGVDNVSFDTLYVPAAEEMAAFVQSLPASELHHHARINGLLDHALETAMNALKLRQAFLLPPNADPEAVRKRSDVWTYGVYLAALFHDIGKAATDHDVEMLDESGQLIAPWSALSGPMSSPYYRAKFKSDRKYEHHQKLGAVVMRPLLPEAALNWLFSDTELTIQLIEFLSGESGGVLASIVRGGDMASVKRDISEAEIPASLSETSLPGRLLTAFRDMLDSGRLPINKPGAAAWVTAEDVWLVSKRAIDNARDHIRTTSAVKIPNDNQACMDELLAAQICIALESDDRKAIWRMRVTDGDWSMSLSFLRIDIARIWRNETHRPVPFSGLIDPTSSPAASKAIVTEELIAPDRMQATETDADLSACRNEEQEPVVTSVQHDDLPEPEAFQSWVRDGVTAGRLKINTNDAMLHVVEEGLLLVSPRIFKRYTQGDGRWKKVQQRVLKKSSVLLSTEGANIITYCVAGERRTSSINGVVVTNAEETFGMALPSPNQHFTRETSCRGVI